MNSAHHRPAGHRRRAASPGRPTVYRGGTVLIGGPEWDAMDDGAVVVIDGHIAEVAPWSTIASGLDGETRVVDLGPATLMPGLIDAHVHLGFDGGPDPVGRMAASSDAQLTVLMLRSARDLLNVGVTTARDLGARGFLDVLVRDAIAAGDAPGPRILAAGAPLTPTGGHCWFLGGEADGPQALRARVRDHRKRGVDLVKVMVTGGYMTRGFGPREPQLHDDELQAVVAEAHRLGVPVTAHVHGVSGIAQALDAGVDELEHCSFLHPDGEVRWDPVLGERIRAQGVAVAPTAHFRNRAVTESRDGDFVPRVGEMYRAGLTVLASTDAGVNDVPHHAFVGALEVMHWLGMPRTAVLDSATWIAARALGLGAVTGRLAAGLAADLIAVDGDPREDLAALDALELVVAAGREHLPEPVPDWRAIPLPTPEPHGSRR
ncbi:imidazolonepropionase-like amidohydrolase [Salana multivorans]|uniref:Imidazolonepropionase-like amidohydrolase n=1 Tax=Salana multivorans TaxID=120377 RepID=A0A3N2DBD5_9MICO|nr:amidohydrolase family protein [Salana multivorans]ROR97120.1 imidazolonepropionase-like amidohydrolase [Salana multivorans]